jgi:hypothetical protein
MEPIERDSHSRRVVDSEIEVNEHRLLELSVTLRRRNATISLSKIRYVVSESSSTEMDSQKKRAHNV